MFRNTLANNWNRHGERVLSNMGIKTGVGGKAELFKQTKNDKSDFFRQVFLLVGFFYTRVKCVTI